MGRATTWVAFLVGYAGLATTADLEPVPSLVAFIAWTVILSVIMPGERSNCGLVSLAVVPDVARKSTVSRLLDRAFGPRGPRSFRGSAVLLVTSLGVIWGLFYLAGLGLPVSLAGAGVGLAGAALAWPHRRHRGHYLTGALLLLVASLLPLGALTDGSHPVDQMYGLALVAVVLVGLLLGNLADHRLLVRTLDAAGPGQLDAVAREMLDGGFHGLPGAVDPSSP